MTRCRCAFMLFCGLLLVPSIANENASHARENAPNASMCSDCAFASKLVLHVGPHKTGTTSLQNFMVDHKAWLKLEYDINVPMSIAKEGAYIANTVQHELGLGLSARTPNANPGGRWHSDFVSTEKASSSMRKLSRALSSAGSLVFFSAEDFDSFQFETWTRFLEWLRKSLPAGVRLCVMIVLGHRSPAAVGRSRWEEANKRLQNPISFPTYLARNSFDALHLAEVLEFAFGRKCLRTFSYEYLKERALSPAVFVVCNVSQQLDDEQWAACRESVRKRERAHMGNVSPPPAAIDVVRLAHHVFSSRAKGKARAAKTKCRLALSSTMAKVQQVAAQLPTYNFTYSALLGEFFKARWLAELERLQAPPPSSIEIDSFDIVDEAKLNSYHYQLIKRLLPQC